MENSVFLGRYEGSVKRLDSPILTGLCPVQYIREKRWKFNVDPNKFYIVNCLLVLTSIYWFEANLVLYIILSLVLSLCVTM